MNIEVKYSTKSIDYSESMKILEKRVQEVHEGKKGELLWLLEHNPVYTAGASSKNSDLLDKKIKVIKQIEEENIPITEKVKKSYILY